MRATDSDANSDEPFAGSRLGASNASIYAPGGSPSITMASDTTSSVGSNTAMNIRNPYTAVNYSIALFGLFPSRN